MSRRWYADKLGTQGILLGHTIRVAELTDACQFARRRWSNVCENGWATFCTTLTIDMDMRVRNRTSVVGDNTNMPFRASSFDVVVYDPPHVPNQGKDKLKDFTDRFGLGVRSTKENGYSFAHTFPPFLKEAYEILKPDGVLFGKVTDYVHDHRYQWAHVDLIKAAEAVGFVACDCIIKVRKGPIVDPKWKTAHHSRRQHAYWLVFRKSRDCE